MKVIDITSENFEKEVLESKVPVLLDFWAEWCGPCKMQSPVVDEVAEELGDAVKVGKVNVDEEAALALKYQIMNIPTLITMKDGIFRERVSGLQSREELLDLLKRTKEQE